MKTVSLELAKELKKAGFPQIGDRATADEILELLPDRIRKENEQRRFLRITKEEGYGEENGIIDTTVWETLRWNVFYENGLLGVPKGEYQSSRYLADAAAKLWLHLKKNNLL